jgi:23S rRNA (pseudouridine1915-N3)-methyltransferase
MKIQVITVNNRPPDWAQQACDDYARRMPTDWQLQFKNVKPADRQDGKKAAQYMATEAQRILTAIKGNNGCLVALDERGKALTTHGLLHLIQQENNDKGAITFVIGGADGLAPEIKTACHHLVQLSALTLPHAMAKVLLVEQIYRAAAIASNHPYHRD